METVQIVRVKFLWPGKMLEFTNPHDLPLKRQDKVVVETYNGGTMVGSVAIEPRIRLKRREDKDLSPVLRIASDQDIALESVQDDFKNNVKRFFDTRVRARELTGVKMVDCEKADGGRRLILYVLSENKRFDPREFSIELGHKFGVRIDLRPVGVRDAARLAGGIGKCGLSMCCSTWLPDFGQVSIRMAKDQGLSLEPDSISGQCGRLLCCLGYEHQNYVEMGKGLPKVGKTVVTPIGDARVVKLDVLKGVVSVRTPEGVFETFEAKDVRRKFGPGGSQAQEQESEEEESVPELPES
jgi:cell fate regulator YaaT (PSP1 superfamily)